MINISHRYMNDQVVLASNQECLPDFRYGFHFVHETIYNFPFVFGQTDKQKRFQRKPNRP